MSLLFSQVFFFISPSMLRYSELDSTPKPPRSETDDYSPPTVPINELAGFYFNGAYGLIYYVHIPPKYESLALKSAASRCYPIFLKCGLETHHPLLRLGINIGLPI